MLKITNESGDKDFIVTAREMLTGRDGQSVTVEPGKSASIQIDGDHQVVIATGGRKPDEAPIPEVPVAKIEGDESDASTTSTTESTTTLPEADDDTVRGEIQAMVDEKVNLTRSGSPELPELNKRLEAKGFGPVNASRRDALMPQPA